MSSHSPLVLEDGPGPPASSRFTSALWFRRFGDPLQDRPESKIRVRMIYTPINPSDIIPITGAYYHTVKPPQIAGYEGVGVVVEANRSAESLVGRRVLPLRGTGTWQCYVDCETSWAVPVPDDIEDTLAARAYINPLAAYLMLKKWPVRAKRVL